MSVEVKQQECRDPDWPLIEKYRELEAGACNVVTRRFFNILREVWNIRTHKDQYRHNWGILRAISQKGLIRVTGGSIYAARDFMRILKFSDYASTYILYNRFTYLKTRREILQAMELDRYKHQDRYKTMPTFVRLQVSGGLGFFCDVKNLTPKRRLLASVATT